MNTYLKRVFLVVLLLIIIIVTICLYWFTQAMSYRNEAKQSVLEYLHRNYKGLSFDISYMHHGGFFGSSFIGKDYTVSVDTEINSKPINFMVWTDRDGKAKNDDLIKQKLSLDVGEDAKKEVSKIIPTVEGVSAKIDYDAKMKHIQNGGSE